MIVRCGRCRVELEVAGAGEFACPNCGTRNVVRGAAPPGFGLPDLGAPPSGAASGLAGTPPPAPSAPPPEVEWMTCPSCSYRFAVGEVESVACPTCGHLITLRDASASAENT